MKLKPMLFSLAALAIIIASCDNEPKVDKKAEFEQQVKGLFEEHFKLLNEHELKSLTDQYAANAIISNDGWKGLAKGAAGADQIFHLEFYVSPDAKYLVDNTTIKDSTVVVEYDVIGLKEKTTGIRYDLRKCSVFKTDGSKITYEATYANPLFYQKGNN